MLCMILEDEASKAAQEKLVQLDGDVAVVMELREGMARVIQRYEAVQKDKLNGSLTGWMMLFRRPPICFRRSFCYS